MIVSSPIRLIRSLLWLYFLLIIVEGALRKWAFPGLSDILLVVRDPVALLASALGWKLLLQRPWWAWIQPLLIIGLIAFLLAVTVGHGDILTALFGLRVFLLHLPLLFLYAIVFDRFDVVRFAQATAFLVIPMTLLIVAQSNLPADHFLNLAPGGQGTAVFQGALDRFRPPGTFSFISGVSSFFTLSAAAVCILLFCIPLSTYSRLASPFLVASLVVALPVSISRALLAGYLQVLVSLILATSLSRSKTVPLLTSLLALGIAILIGIRLPAFHSTADAFVARWDAASALDSTPQDRGASALVVFQDRVLQPLLRPFEDPDQYPFLGLGIGMGTNVGAQRLSGQRSFLIDEDSWPATLGELGLPLGFCFLAWRVSLSFLLTHLSIRSAFAGNRLPMILLGSSLLPLFSGQLSQPTNLGFIVVSAGLTLAAVDLQSRSARSKPSLPPGRGLMSVK